MCGIVGYIGERDCSEVLLNALSKLEYRGYDSAGIAVFEDGEIHVEKAKGELKNLKEIVDQNKPDGHVGIGHTRWATHGEPSDINSHPHGNKRVSIVHNGIILQLRNVSLKQSFHHFDLHIFQRSLMVLLRMLVLLSRFLRSIF